MTTPESSAPSVLPDVAALRAIKDPARRFLAARAAADAAREVFTAIEAQAAADLVAAHRTISAAAREVGMIPQGFTKRLEILGRPEGRATHQEEPARRFESQEDAEDALRDYGLLLEEVTDELGPLVLGAEAAGIHRHLIYEHTRTGPDTLAWFLPATGGIEVAEPVDFDELETFARWITARARALKEAATTWSESCEAQIWDLEARRFVTNCAPASLHTAPDVGVRESGPETPAEEFATYLHAVAAACSEEKKHDTPGALDQLTDPDAWLSVECIGLGREAARIRERLAADPGTERANGEVAIADAFAELASAFRQLRRTGKAPNT
ncbi:hypothetical protein [Streptomyces sp. ISL-100]|uniref:hypothetical protein n=1 Tax=Streptomyces sp. ISL-100 TaxID=2819173 RepID=UPI001BED04BB|nr:hypothetical protein [Streptomyces sp. ISL-100]MBT2400818.1 hypothetical protein [Streptomyces sp. ISL-100]